MKRLIILLLAAILLGLPRPARGAVADTTEYGDLVLEPDLLLHPGQPCDGRNVALFVQGYAATLCDSFIGVAQLPGQPVTIRTLTRPYTVCLVDPTRFFAVRVDLGRLGAGTHSLIVRRQRLTEGEDGTLDSTATESGYQFQVTAECPVIAPVPVTDLPYVDAAATQPPRPCPDQLLALALGGTFPNGCGRLESATAADPGRVNLVLAPYPPTLQPCLATLVLKPWKAAVPLGLFEPGTHTVEVDLTVRGALWLWPPVPDARHLGRFEFTVTTPCDSVPSTPLPYVESIHVRPDVLCAEPVRPICPSDSIRVTITGRFPHDCCATKRIELLPSPIMGPMPEPPIVRVVVDHDVFVRCACPEELVPWYGSVVLPPLPQRDYQLFVEVLERGGGRDSTLATTRVPFQVSGPENCGSVARCLDAGWVHQGPYGSCDVFVSNEQHGTVTMQVLSRVALSGLQGRLRAGELGLRIIGIRPVGPAAGMRLSWVPLPDGARFVMFSEQGAPLPANQRVPILEVDARAEPLAHIPENPPPIIGPVFHLGLEELLGADENGNGVTLCPPPPCADVRLLPDLAVFCLERPCDFNRDGLDDVRDIVRMVRCALATGPCPPDLVPRFDCDHSGDFGLADVLCCAMEVLNGPDCPTCPLDTLRVEPAIAVRLGPARRTADGLFLPLSIEGTEKIGAARLRWRFPSDRFELRVSGLGPILTIHEVRGDVLTLGLIGSLPIPVPLDGGGPQIIDPGPLGLYLTVRPGQSYGGEVRLLDGQFSGPDGVMLDVDLVTPPVPALPGGEAVALSAPQPNPFSASTRFTVAIDSPSRLDIAVHDVSGRRLATVFRGNRGAGVQEFSWDGRDDDGGQVANGVYFLRVLADARVLKRKLVLIRDVRAPVRIPASHSTP